MTDATMEAQKDAAQVKRYDDSENMAIHWMHRCEQAEAERDAIASQHAALTVERDALQARVEALELAMQTAINEIHYDDDSASAEKTLRKALAGDRP